MYNLTQEQLKHTLMPVGEYEKDRIRQIAEEQGLPVAHKPDSQEICFIPDNNYKRFLEEETGEKASEGNFVDCEGMVIGRHRGITHYTVGQRKGLNLALGHPVFVVEIRPETNEVVIGQNEDVYAEGLLAADLQFMATDQYEEGQRMLAKIRYSDKGQMCTVKQVNGDSMKIIFDHKVRAVTPGQAVVFYQDHMVLGGGTIVKGFCGSD